MPISWKTHSGTIGDDENVQWRWLAGDDPILDQGENLLIDPSSQATFLIAKINHEWVGQFQSGHYNLHAEEVLLETLRQNWQALLAEKVVWRPTKATPRNLLSIKLTRSPCDEPGHTCGKKIVAFLKAMNVAATADEEDIRKYNPMRVNWNLHIRTKIRTIYKGKPSTEENLQKSKDALLHLIDNGVLVRPWELEKTVKTGKETRTGSALPKTETHIHETAYITKSFFAQKVANKGYHSQSRSQKLNSDIAELNSFLDKAYEKRFLGLHTKPGEREKWSSFMITPRSYAQPTEHLRSFALVTVKAELEEKLLGVLQQLVKEAEPSLAKLPTLFDSPVVDKPEEYEEYLATVEQKFLELCKTEVAARLSKALNP